jgi:hypothetical protein
MVMFHASCRHLVAVLSLPALLIGLSMGTHAREPVDVNALQDLVDGLKTQLGIHAIISVAIVPTNPLLVSVQPIDGGPGTFRMAFEEQFLKGLDNSELRAIVAHELGHVWIFTHHPYLQTERLANTVAMRAVPRESLERVYAKVWARGGTKGNLVRFLGPE